VITSYFLKTSISVTYLLSKFHYVKREEIVRDEFYIEF